MTISIKNGFYGHLRVCLTWLLPLIILLSNGCSTLVGSATEGLASSLSSAILNSDDIETVEQGLPAYLLLLDGLIENDPHNTSLLMAAAKLNSAYASIFPQSQEQAIKLSNKALNYAKTAICQKEKRACALQEQPFEIFENIVLQFKPSQVDVLYTLGATWASWIEVNKADWNAIADIGHVKSIMEQVVQLDETHEAGSAHLYLGVLDTLLPPALGGKPEQGKSHFQRAIELSGEKNLMAKVTYAKSYARLVFERELHDQLLKDVIEAKPRSAGFTLINTLAQQQARELLGSADDYF